VRAYLPAFDLRAPETLDEALALLSSNTGCRPFAGGTDLMVQLEAGTLPETRYVGLWKLKDLGGHFVTRSSAEITSEILDLGALTTYTDILQSAIVQRDFPLLCQAAAETGGVATQNRGTVGGNIANASPAADTPPALLVYNAELELVSQRGSRRVLYDRFHLGYKKMDLAPDELIARIRLPKRDGPWRQYYRKVGTRRAQAISKVCFAAALRVVDGVVRDLRIAVGSVAPTVIRARRAEDALRDHAIDGPTLREAQDALAADIAPIDDIRSTGRYRLRVAQRLLAECLHDLGGR
jgi:CO/xanthine dehydrogenase FAD-binding subunit